MPILVLCQDSPDAPLLRKKHLQAHLSYIEGIIGELSVAGPLSENTVDYNGSCFIYATDNLSEAQMLFDNDPYAKAKVYEAVTFSYFKPAAGTWLGGVTW